MPALFVVVSFLASSLQAQVPAGASVLKPERDKHVRTIVPLTPDHMGIFAEDRDVNCDHWDAILSPSGKYLISSRPIWRQATAAQNSMTVAVTDLNCVLLNTSGSECSLIFQAFDGLRPIAWSKDETSIFMIEQDRNLVEVGWGAKIQDARVIGRISLGVRLGRTIASFDVTSSSNVIQEAHRLRGADTLVRSALGPDDRILNLFVRDGSTPTAIAERDPSLATMLVIGDRTWPLPVPGPALMRSQISFEGGQKRSVVGTGFRIDIGHKAKVVPTPYDKPLISVSDGRLKEFVGPWTHISGRLAGPSAEDAGELIAFDRNGQGDEVRLIRQANRTIVKGLRNNQIWTGDCKADADATAPIRDTLVSLGTSDRPLMAIRSSTQNTQKRRLAIFFPGGPGGGVIEPSQNYIVRRFLEMDYDVLTVNYSGTAGSGMEVANRLRTEGAAQAIGNDMRALLDSDKLGTPSEILIVGVSLGGLPALELDQQLQTPAGHRLILIEPLLLYREPASRVSDPSYEPYQRAYEAALLGLSNPELIKIFGHDLMELQQSRSKFPVFLAFGRHDLLSAPSDWTQPLRSQDRLLTLNADHDFAPFEPELWSSLRQWLSK